MLKEQIADYESATGMSAKALFLIGAWGRRTVQRSAKIL